MAAAGPLAASAAEASSTPKRPFWPAGLMNNSSIVRLHRNVYQARNRVS
jgi:hypothetical protein